MKLTTGNKILWKRGEELFHLFSTIFSIYLKLQEPSYTVIKFCEMWFSICFLNSANLICRGTDISKYFRGSRRLRDNESRLYLYIDAHIWAAKSITYLPACASSEDLDQPVHSCSLIRFFTGHILDSWISKFSSCGQWRLVRLRECVGWFESLLGPHVRGYVF